ncbi:MAG: carbohydrate ABC transporter permease [Pleomorphochaeta sp.]
MKMNKLSKTIRAIVLLIIMLFLLFPIYWMLVTSFKTNMEAYLYPPSFFPKNFVLDGFRNLFTENNEFFVYYFNNFLVSFISAIITCFVAIFAGYSIARFNTKWSKVFVAILLSSQMFPIISRMISLYSMMSKMGIINTRTGLILAIVAAQVPFCCLLLSSFFINIPKEIEEAAEIDGASRNTILFKLLTPLVTPGILAVGIYAFLMTWDDYLHAATLIQSDNLRTLSVGISLRYLGELSYDWSLINSISVIGTLPMVLVFFFFQKYMVKGLVAGAVKG